MWSRVLSRSHTGRTHHTDPHDIACPLSRWTAPGGPDGATPLMAAAYGGHSRVIRILLGKGAKLSIAKDQGFTALHLAAQEGHLAASKLLAEARPSLEAVICEGCTPLHLAAVNGRWGVVRVLLDAGANPDSRTDTGATPLYLAAQNGHLEAVRQLLRADADPLVIKTDAGSTKTYLALDVAAGNGHSHVVRELIQRFGIAGCGGDSAGAHALDLAANYARIEVMDMLANAGVVDTGMALIRAGQQGNHRSMKFLLQRQSGWKTAEGAAYADNVSHPRGYTPLLVCIATCRSCSPGIAQLLVWAGADTTSAVPVTDSKGAVVFSHTPLAFTESYLSDKDADGNTVSEEKRHTLEAIRRLLLRVDAVHALSWLWRHGCSRADDRAAKGKVASKGQTAAAPDTPLRRMLPLMRRRARRRGMPLPAMFRWVGNERVDLQGRTLADCFADQCVSTIAFLCLPFARVAALRRLAFAKRFTMTVKSWLFGIQIATPRVLWGSCSCAAPCF